MFEAQVTALLDLIQVSRRNHSVLYAIVISFGQFAGTDRLEPVLSDFHRRGLEATRKLGGELIQISPTDFVLLAELGDYQLLGTLPELKMLLLRLIRSHLPDSFCIIDQAQLVRPFNLHRDRAALRKRLEAYLTPAVPLSVTHGGRRLTERDVQKVNQACRTGGLGPFAERYVRTQPIAVIYGSHPPEAALREHFVSMERIRRDILPDVNLATDHNMFNVLTIELDKIALEALQRDALDSRFATFNMNIETVFTRTFEQAAESGRLKNLIFEFRAVDILENIDKFDVVKRAIEMIGARIAVDNVVPRMLRVLRPGQFGAAFVKVFYDAEAQDPEVMAGIRDIGQRGARVILARVEEEGQVEVGKQLGIDMYQGFYIDAVLRDAATREKVMVA